MSSQGPSDRDLFENESAALYEELVNSGGLRATDPRVAEDGPQRKAFDQLVDLGLVLRNVETDRWQAVDPSTVASHVVAPMSREGSRLLEESSAWSRALTTLNQTYRRAPVVAGHEALTHLRDEAIGPYLSNLVSECEFEILTAQPQTGRDPQTLIDAALRDTSALDRGVKMRTLYQHSARRSTITHNYVAAVSARGAEVRTLDEFFKRMIVLDRRVAIIPGQDDLRVAIAVRDPGLVSYLADIFDRTWQRARPFTNRERTMLKDIAAEQRAMTIRMLVEGHADPASAKRLGVSPRTYAGYVADLKHEFEAETRFQLGYTMAQQGVTGNEHVGDDDRDED